MKTKPLSDFDNALMSEIEELFRHQLAAGERDGLSVEELNQLAERFHRMFELVDNGLQQQSTSWANRAFRDDTYHFIADGLMEKLHTLYDEAVPLSSSQTNKAIERTRHKLRRIRIILEC